MTRKHKGEPVTSKRRVAAALKQRDAIQLRIEGETLDTIAATVGYRSRSGAHKAILAGLTKALREPSDQLREIENRRLDAMLAAVWKRVLHGDLKAIDAAIRISARRGALNGLDMPTRHQVDPILVMDGAELSDLERAHKIWSILENARQRRDAAEGKGNGQDETAIH